MVMCSEYIQQVRLFEMAEREFRRAHIAMMGAIKYDEAKSSRATLRLAVRNRNACRAALTFHEMDHGCAVASASA
jgi:hypothetical protein